MLILPSRASMAINLTQPFAGSGGTPPYTFKVLPSCNGSSIGGTVGASSGIYTSPGITGSDIVQVTDSLGATAQATVYVRTPLNLFCDVIQVGMGLPDGRVYLYDQKIFEPTDYDLFIVVGILIPKPFANTRILDLDGLSVQSVNMHTTLSVDIKSRGPAARDRKEEVILALNSQYSENQQELNSFRIFPLTSSFVNLSELDGAAIPYRFNLTCNVQYFVTKKSVVSFYDSFSPVAVTVDTS